MLRESEVIAAVRRFLEGYGCTVEKCCAETEQGDDIVGHFPKGGARLTVEAKGETSSKPHTARFGKTFSGPQVRNHVANAFYRAAQRSGNDILSAVALPKNAAHLACVGKVAPAMKTLGIEVFWVSPDGSVEVAGYWPVWTDIKARSKLRIRARG